VIFCRPLTRALTNLPITPQARACGYTLSLATRGKTLCAKIFFKVFYLSSTQNSIACKFVLKSLVQPKIKRGQNENKKRQ
jgi:hypothetical protein